MSVWHILHPFGIFYSRSVYFTSIRFILHPFGIFYSHLVYFLVVWYIFPVLESCSKNNLATLFYYIGLLGLFYICEVMYGMVTYVS
jgi:hypothetical protein